MAKTNNTTEETRELRIKEWLGYAEQGVAIPVTITLDGTSMQPLIRKGLDKVTIIPLDRELVIGDIVMFERTDGVYVMHRVYRLSDNMVLTWGDNCLASDCWMDIRAIKGIAVRISRNGRALNPNTFLMRLYGKARISYQKHKAGGIRLIYPVYRKIKDRIKGLL